MSLPALDNLVRIGQLKPEPLLITELCALVPRLIVDVQALMTH
jgi:hypothetical protein